MQCENVNHKKAVSKYVVKAKMPIVNMNNILAADVSLYQYLLFLQSSHVTNYSIVFVAAMNKTAQIWLWYVLPRLILKNIESLSP